MKSYTDIPQSKKLAEILPIESADLWYAEVYEGNIDGWNFSVSNTPYYSMSLVKPSENNYSQNVIKDIPCWSLTALLNVIPNDLENNEGYYLTLMNDGEWFCSYRNIDGDYNKQVIAKNPIDACVKMIELLYKENLI